MFACSTHHLPPGFHLSNLLPLLSLLLHLLELHAQSPTEDRDLSSSSTQQGLMPSAVAIHPLQLLSLVLSTMENMHKLVDNYCWFCSRAFCCGTQSLFGGEEIQWGKVLYCFWRRHHISFDKLRTKPRACSTGMTDTFMLYDKIWIKLPHSWRLKCLIAVSHFPCFSTLRRSSLTEWQSHPTLFLLRNLVI